jgi:putative DNA primase/helicase
LPGKWIYNLRGIEPVLYRYPELIGADPHHTCCLVEGEKDADRLASMGQVATTNPMGAGKWHDRYAEAFRGRIVAILPDNDQVGREHAATIARSLQGIAAGTRVVELPDLPEKGDVSDWLDAGHGVDELAALVEQTSEWSGPAQTDDQGPTARQLDIELARRPRTDTGVAERLVRRFGDRLRYVHPWRKPLIWDGTRWKADDTAEVRRLAKRTARLILAEAATLENPDEAKDHARFALVSESRARIDAVLTQAYSEEGVPILPDELDQDPWLLNVRNGTIDLRTGRLRSHRRSDYLTKLCPVHFDRHAECPVWESMLAKVLGSNAALIGFLQRIVGYSLTGVVHEQVLPIFHGKGSNGKSTVLNVLLSMLGTDYAMKAQPDLLMARRGEQHPTALADLFGKRLVVANETGEGHRLNESLVKELTGSDKIRARRMREDYWEFSPTHKIILSTNHRPEVRGTDHAIWRRIRLIPFDVTIPDDEQDARLPEKLAAELPGILAWCVRGCLAWLEIGLNPPDPVSRATDGYRREQDSIGAL